jgi:hypothetical protein
MIGRIHIDRCHPCAVDWMIRITQMEATETHMSGMASSATLSSGCIGGSKSLSSVDLVSASSIESTGPLHGPVLQQTQIRWINGGSSLGLVRRSWRGELNSSKENGQK